MTTHVVSTHEVERKGLKSKLISRSACTWPRDHLCSEGLDFHTPIQTTIRMRKKKKKIEKKREKKSALVRETNSLDLFFVILQKFDAKTFFFSLSAFVKNDSGCNKNKVF